MNRMMDFVALCSAAAGFALLAHVVNGQGWWHLALIPGVLIVILVFGAVIGDRKGRADDGNTYE